ncbi:MAG TPA: transglycosylase SLT domain-containing protein, partial [Sphingobacteriaceae bacterium]|nr:transglycosylase SLT domain-containing protein [Sphingobacteriaceae bacterium]
FPIFEKNFKQVGIPEEIKYLSIIESSLDPHAVSRVGATGPWQFMHATARVYGLEMNRLIDERKDPDIASHAAARYIKEAYERFDDWLLAIAAYNCGPGNVLKAIKRSGKENPDFWEIQAYLPRETRNYIPAYIAMLYVMESASDFGIEPAETELQIKTEVVNVQSNLSLSTLAAVLQEDESLLAALNPAYKGGKINGSLEQPRRLVLPEVSMESYPHLYAVLHEAHALPEATKLLLAQVDAEVSQSNPNALDQRTTYTVRRGDTLSGIASKHKGATVSRIKTANNLKSNRIQPGMKLIITF